MTEQLPNGWAVAHLTDLAVKITDGTHQPPKFVDAGIPFVVIGNIRDDGIDWTSIKKWVSEETFAQESRRIRPQIGDVLYSAVGSYGMVVEVKDNRPFMFQRHIAYIRPELEVIKSTYLARALASPVCKRQADAVARGVAQRTVTLGDLGQYKLPIAPLAEQHRIVTKIDSLFARSSRARDELAHIPKLIERYRQVVLEAAFRGDLTADWRASHPDAQIEIDAEPGMDGPYALPPSWRWVRLPRLGLLGRGKSRHRPRNDPALFGGPYPFIQTGEVRAADGMLTDFRQTYSEQGLAQSKLWPVGTVCITIAANIAETAVLGLDACFPDSVVGFVADEELCLPEYIEFFIRTVRADLEAFAPATAQKNINLDTLEQVLVPLPPLFEQEVILGSVTTAFAGVAQMVEEYQKAGSLIGRLDQSILDKAFSGKLVPQDPADEPASVLLERIQAARAAAPKAKRGRSKKLG